MSRTTVATRPCPACGGDADAARDCTRCDRRGFLTYRVPAPPDQLSFEDAQRATGADVRAVRDIQTNFV